MSIRYSLTRLLRAGASALFWTICSVGWPGVSEATVDSLPYVDLRTYGVKANDPASNTSNTSAVKQALSDFASTGAELHFPSGTSSLTRIRSHRRVPSRTRLQSWAMISYSRARE